MNNNIYQHITAWATFRELEYLQSIGRHHCETAGMSRIELLRRYKVGALRRVYWGDINREVVLAEVDKLIAAKEFVAEHGRTA